MTIAGMARESSRRLAGASIAANYAEKRAAAYLQAALDLAPLVPATTRELFGVLGDEWQMRYTRFFLFLREMEAAGLLASSFMRGSRGHCRVWSAPCGAATEAA